MSSQTPKSIVSGSAALAISSSILAEHAEQHMAAPSGEGRREYEFSHDFVLDGLKRLRRTR